MKTRTLLMALLLSLACGCCVHSLARAMMFPGSPVRFPEGETERYKLVDYVAADGTKLRGAWCFSGTSGAPVVVAFHGNGESAGQNVPFGEALADRGYDVFLAEYRGYGGLAGQPTEKGLYQDGEAAVNAIYASGVSRDRLILLGRSLGTGVAVELAHRGHGRAMVLISPYTSMVDVAKGIAGPLAHLVPDKFDSLSKIGAITIPVVMIHGDVDEVVPFKLGKKLSEHTPHVTFIVEKGYGHNNLVNLPETIDHALKNE